jgi:hypothetical protein
MATKKGSKKTAEKVEEAVEETPVVEETPAPKEEVKVAPKKETKKAAPKKEIPDYITFRGELSEYITIAHEVLLDRKPVDAEMAYFTKLIKVDGLPMPEIMRVIKQSGEYQDKTGSFL